jgi:hypothetical protein
MSTSAALAAAVHPTAGHCSRRCCSSRLKRLAGFRAERSATSERARRAFRARRVALSKASAAARRDVAYTCQPLDAPRIVAATESQRRLAERLCKGFLRHRRRRAVRVDVPKCFEQARGGSSASRSDEGHHSMHDVEGPRASERLHLPAVGQQPPPFSDIEASELQSPQQRRSICERRYIRRACLRDLRVVLISPCRPARVLGIYSILSSPIIPRLARTRTNRCDTATKRHPSRFPMCRKRVSSPAFFGPAISASPR